MARDWYSELEAGAKSNPHYQALSEYLKNLPLQPTSLGAALPLYRVEVPRTIGVGWQGYFAGNPYIKVAEALNSLKLGLIIRTPGEGFRQLPEGIQKHGRFLFTESVGTPEVVGQILKLVQEYPGKLRLLTFPEKVRKYSRYSDPDQIFVPLRKMLRYGKEVIPPEP